MPFADPQLSRKNLRAHVSESEDLDKRYYNSWLSRRHRRHLCKQQRGTQTRTPEMLQETLKLAEYIRNSAPVTSTAPEVPWDSLGTRQKPGHGIGYL